MCKQYLTCLLLAVAVGLCGCSSDDDYAENDEGSSVSNYELKNEDSRSNCRLADAEQRLALVGGEAYMRESVKRILSSEMLADHSQTGDAALHGVVLVDDRERSHIWRFVAIAFVDAETNCSYALVYDIPFS